MIVSILHHLSHHALAVCEDSFSILTIFLSERIGPHHFCITKHANDSLLCLQTQESSTLSKLPVHFAFAMLQEAETLGPNSCCQY